MPTKVPATMIATTGVTPGSYTAADITVNDSGQITSAASNSLVAGGGGSPKVTNIQITNNAYTVLDDTAVALTGGFIRITGTGFVTGCTVIIGSLVATSVSFISATEVRAQVPAQAAGTYTVYLVNPDGGVGIRVNGLNYSSTPTWTTTSPLGDGVIDTAVSIQLVATSNSAVTFALQGGSTLPAGLTLSSSGLITGTVTGITVDTTYNFTVVATDVENQDTPQAFSITITVSDPFFKSTVLLLQADTAPTVITDSSTNNFDLTVFGDTRASNFTPYGTGWSVQFDGNADYFTVPGNTAFAYGTGAFTVEAWVNRVGLGPAIYYSSTILTQAASGNNYFHFSMSGDSNNQVSLIVNNSTILTSTNLNFNQWYHIALVRENTGTNGVKLYVNGVLNVSGTSAANLTDTSLPVSIGDYSHSNILGMNGYISNLRVVKGTAVYTANFTPSTSPLTAISGTSLLTCHTNRFIDGSANNFTITRNGDVAVRSFNPFNLTNTGDLGSMYFDGTGDYIQTPTNAAFQIGTGDYTLECWAYFTATPPNTFAPLVDLRRASPNFVAPCLEVSSSLKLQLRDGSTGTNPLVGATTLSLNTWHHLAITRQSGSTRCFVNGVLDGSVSNTTNFNSTVGFTAGVPGDNVGGAHTFIGYLSNARVVKGTAVYTAAFTPPTTSLTAITNTSLLTLQYRQPHNNHSFQDSSANQFLITRVGNTTQGTFSPFSQTGYSVYFDGVDDYLSIADNAALNLETGNFTVEFWINPSPFTTDVWPDMITKGTGSTADSWKIAYNIGTNSAIFYFGGGGLGSENNQVLPGRWTHIAFVRSGTTLTSFSNGVLSSGTTSCSNNFNNGSSLVIGRWDTQIWNDYTGYISNLRIVKGTALYTTSFTPSTTPLTAVANTSLLTCHDNRFRDGSTNNFTVTRNGDSRVTSFGPFSTTSYTPALHGGSAYMDGTGDYLSLPSDPAWAFGTGDYTMDCWVYINGINTTHAIMGTNYGSGANLGYDNTGGGRLFAWVVGTQLTATSTEFRVGKWMHVAVTRASGTVRLFLDGAVLNSASMTGSVAASIFYVGTNAHATSTEFLNGYISNARVIKGTALYTGAFTPPTSLVTATANTNLLLNFTDAAIRDGRGISVLETLGDTKTSTVQTKYGTGSMRFDGTGDYLVIKDTLPFNFGSNNFTVEFWMNATTSTNPGRIINYWATSTPTAASWQFLTGVTTLFFSCGTAGTSSQVDISGIISLNTWTHVAGVRNGNVFTLYINGTQAATTTQAITLQTANTVTIGARNSGGSYVEFFAGYLDDVRVTPGVARYTANFTPPASKFLSR